MTVTCLYTLPLQKWRIRRDSQFSWDLRCQTWWWWKRERGGGERNGGRRSDEFSFGVFYIPPELVWNHQQVAHARTSLAHPHPVVPHGLIVSRSLLKSLLIAILEAWYKYRAIRKQRAWATARRSPPPLRLPWLPQQRQLQGSPSCRPSIEPWVAERGSFVPWWIVREQLRTKIP